MKATIENLRTTIENVEYIIETAEEVTQKVGRPRNLQARFSLTLRRPRGCRLYASFLYTDGTFCKPF